MNAHLLEEAIKAKLQIAIFSILFVFLAVNVYYIAQEFIVHTVLAEDADTTG